MKAIRIEQFGGPETLLQIEVPEPDIRAGEVLVRVHAVGVNPVDAKIRAGKFARFYPVLPAAIGRDVSGTIVCVGLEVSDLKVGDVVFGMLDYDRGSYAELAMASPREIVLKPPGLGHLEAAALPVAAVTAWQALFEHGKLQPNQRILIHGGAGGVGHFAVQFAVGCGASVFATCSERDIEFVRQLGVEKAIDYRKDRFEEEVPDLDVVLDLVGGEVRKRSWRVLKPGGILVSTLPDPQPEGRSDVSGCEVVVYPSAAHLSLIANLVVSKNIRVNLDRAFSLAQAAAAHRHLEENHPRGKTVLRIL